MSSEKNREEPSLNQEPEEKKQPGATLDQSTIINLKVNSQNRDEMEVRLKSNCALMKLMKAYCEQMSVELNAINFLYDGRRIKPLQTPEQLGMEDGDEIDVFLHQSGGAVL